MKSLCVFCGARVGARPAYADAAVALGRTIAKRGIVLVYGGGHIGLMGVLAKAALEAGGKVVGVIPDFMVERELALAGLTELIIVDSMHARKARMAELSEGFIALPGGLGTFDELFEIMTWAQLGIHNHPVGLLDVAGYFGPFRAMLKQAQAEQFLHSGTRWPEFSDDPADLLDRMTSYNATPIQGAGQVRP